MGNQISSTKDQPPKGIDELALNLRGREEFNEEPPASDQAAVQGQQAGFKLKQSQAYDSALDPQQKPSDPDQQLRDDQKKPLEQAAAILPDAALVSSIASSKQANQPVESQTRQEQQEQEGKNQFLVPTSSCGSDLHLQLGNFNNNPDAEPNPSAQSKPVLIAEQSVEKKQKKREFSADLFDSKIEPEDLEGFINERFAENCAQPDGGQKEAAKEPPNPSHDHPPQRQYCAHYRKKRSLKENNHGYYGSKVNSALQVQNTGSKMEVRLGCMRENQDLRLSPVKQSDLYKKPRVEEQAMETDEEDSWLGNNLCSLPEAKPDAVLKPKELPTKEIPVAAGIEKAPEVPKPISFFEQASKQKQSKPEKVSLSENSLGWKKLSEEQIRLATILERMPAEEVQEYFDSLQSTSPASRKADRVQSGAEHDTSGVFNQNPVNLSKEANPEIAEDKKATAEEEGQDQASGSPVRQEIDAQQFQPVCGPPKQSGSPPYAKALAGSSLEHEWLFFLQSTGSELSLEQFAVKKMVESLDPAPEVQEVQIIDPAPSKLFQQGYSPLKIDQGDQGAQSAAKPAGKVPNDSSSLKAIQATFDQNLVSNPDQKNQEQRPLAEKAPSESEREDSYAGAIRDSSPPSSFSFKRQQQTRVQKCSLHQGRSPEDDDDQIQPHEEDEPWTESIPPSYLPKEVQGISSYGGQGDPAFQRHSEFLKTGPPRMDEDEVEELPSYEPITSPFNQISSQFNVAQAASARDASPNFPRGSSSFPSPFLAEQPRLATDLETDEIEVRLKIFNKSIIKKVRSAKLYQEFVPADQFVEMALDACRPHFSHLNMDFANIFVFDRKQRLVRISQSIVPGVQRLFGLDNDIEDKLKGPFSFEQALQAWNSATREKDIDIYLPDGPFELYFPQKLPLKEFDHILRGAQEFRCKSKNYYPQQTSGLVKEIEQLLLFDIKKNTNFFEAPFGGVEEEAEGCVPSELLQQTIQWLKTQITSTTKLAVKKGEAGDLVNAFNNEYKVRDLVSPLLKMVVQLNQNEFYIEYEKSIPVFQGNLSSGKGSCLRPDFELVGRDQTTVCTIEVKKLYASYMSQKSRGRHADQLEENRKALGLASFEASQPRARRDRSEEVDIEDHLSQSIQQLRSQCVFHKQNQMYGLITNGRDWIFTRYNLEQEMLNANSREALQGSCGQFEYSNAFRIFEIDLDNVKINPEGIAKVVHLIGSLFVNSLASN